VWLVVALVLMAAIGYGLWRAAGRARSIEDDTRYLLEGRGPTPYGRKFLRILSGRRS
jgi:hypothetical protein